MCWFAVWGYKLEVYQNNHSEDLDSEKLNCNGRIKLKMSLLHVIISHKLKLNSPQSWTVHPISTGAGVLPETDQPSAPQNGSVDMELQTE